MIPVSFQFPSNPAIWLETEQADLQARTQKLNSTFFFFFFFLNKGYLHRIREKLQSKKKKNVGLLAKSYFLKTYFKKLIVIQTEEKLSNNPSLQSCAEVIKLASN